MNGKIGFDNEKYLKEQSEAILERIAQSDNKLYLEFGGKIVFDYHAARVLPGFDPNIKVSLLQKLKDKAEVLLCIYAGDIERKKLRADFGIPYDAAALKPGLLLERQALAALQVVEVCENPAFEMRVESVDVADPESIEVRLTYGDREREVRLAWRGMGEPGPAAQRDLLQALGRVKQAFDAEPGRRLTRLDATLDGKVYGK